MVLGHPVHLNISTYAYVGHYVSLSVSTKKPDFVALSFYHAKMVISTYINICELKFASVTINKYYNTVTKINIIISISIYRSRTSQENYIIQVSVQQLHVLLLDGYRQQVLSQVRI